MARANPICSMPLEHAHRSPPRYYESQRQSWNCPGQDAPKRKPLEQCHTGNKPGSRMVQLRHATTALPCTHPAPAPSSQSLHTVNLLTIGHFSPVSLLRTAATRWAPSSNQRRCPLCRFTEQTIHRRKRNLIQSAGRHSVPETNIPPAKPTSDRRETGNERLTNTCL